MSRNEQDTDISDSNPNATGPAKAAGGMGVSSEREGHTGPGQHGTDGVRDVTEAVKGQTEDAPPEKAPGAEETNPEGLDPKAGYSKIDPRSED